MFRSRFASCWVVILVCVSVYSQYSEPISSEAFRNSHNRTLESSLYCPATGVRTAHSISVQSSDPLYLHSKWALVPLYQDGCATVVCSIYDHSSELSPMDAEGIVRRPRRIAGGDHDSFSEGEDGEKLPEVGTTKDTDPNPTPIGDVPIEMFLLLSLIYLLYRKMSKSALKY